MTATIPSPPARAPESAGEASEAAVEEVAR